MATQEMYDKIKNLTRGEIIEVAKHCCGDLDDNDFCENECLYLDVREENGHRPNSFCRQWVMHDILKIIDETR